MTYPRSHLIDPNGAGIYHLCSRCVRKSWLCGVEESSGRDFSRRRDWIVKQTLYLADIYPISVPVSWMPAVYLSINSYSNLAFLFFMFPNRFQEILLIEIHTFVFTMSTPFVTIK